MDEAFGHIEVTPRKRTKGGKKMYPPDGGWGYAVCVGVGLTFMLGFGSSSAFGILFHQFFMDRGGASGLTLVIGVYNGALSIAGFLSGIALKKYSYRQVGLVGASLFVLGDLLTIFVSRTYQLVFSFGLIRGAGFGVMIPVSYTAFNSYFTKKSTAMMSANQAMSSVASITFPMMVTFLLTEYGFRGTLTILMAIDLHVIVAMLVMHPVEWHLIEIGSSKDLECLSAVEIQVKTSAQEVQKIAPPNLSSIDKFTKKSKEKRSREAFEKSLLKKIIQNIELDLLKQKRFLITLLGIGFAFVSDVTYLAMEPMLLFSYGFTQVEVALCVMLGATADLLARFSLAFYTFFRPLDSRKVFYFGTCITVVLRIALVSGSSFWYVCTVTIASGCVRCAVQVLFPLVLGVAAPEDRFSGALALHIISSGLLMLLADPCIGMIYELTGSYVYCFVAMSACCMVCVVLWSGEYCSCIKRKDSMNSCDSRKNNDKIDHQTENAFLPE